MIFIAKTGKATFQQRQFNIAISIKFRAKTSFFDAVALHKCSRIGIMNTNLL